jgi:ABC-2 type transport system ATP-binding protein
MKAIETEALTKVYGETVAVDGLSMSVERGEVFGFLGPNGAGKTTTVKMLLGLVNPTAGEAQVLGHEVGDTAAMAQVGFLPEHFLFHPWMTGYGLLEMYGRLYGMSRGRRRRRIPELLALVGLSDRANSRIGEYSKGMMQRVGLAQALLNEPELVFLDEPTSGLDPLGCRQVRGVIRELGASGVTVFLNSHLLTEVEATCDRIAIISQGRLIKIGRQQDLVDQRVEVEVRAGGLTLAIRQGLARWGQVTPLRDGHLTLQIETEDVLPAIARYLVEAGVRLYALWPRSVSLEELFVQAVEEAE